MALLALNSVNPAAYITETLQTILNGHPQSRIEELMPWRFQIVSSLAAICSLSSSDKCE
jgi:transposase